MRRSVGFCLINEWRSIEFDYDLPVIRQCVEVRLGRPVIRITVGWENYLLEFSHCRDSIWIAALGGICQHDSIILQCFDVHSYWKLLRSNSEAFRHIWLRCSSERQVEDLTDDPMVSRGHCESGSKIDTVERKDRGPISMSDRRSDMAIPPRNAKVKR